MSRFKKSQRLKARLRMGLDGTSGTGKSLTALRLAHAFRLHNPACQIACIEAGERGGLSLYTNTEWDGQKLDFHIHELSGHYGPMEYVACIEEAGREGFDVLVIDSLSHAWAGAGGVLEQVQGKKWTDEDGWRKASPQHARLIDAILQSPCHVIATLRSKTSYVFEENERGQKIPRKIGLEPIQRAGMEYEFTIYGSMDQQHSMTITKSRCSFVQDAIVHKPGANFMLPVINWLETGEINAKTEEAVSELKRRASEDQLEAIAALIAAFKLPASQVKNRLQQAYGVDEIARLTSDQADEMIAKMQAKLEERNKPPEEDGGAVVKS